MAAQQPTYYEMIEDVADLRMFQGELVRCRTGMYTVYATYEDGSTVRREPRAQHVTERDGHIIIGALERADELTRCRT